MNVTRQLLGNRFGQLRDDFTAAYEAGDVAKAKGLAVQMDELLLDLDMLLATDPDFSMCKWIDQKDRMTPISDENPVDISRRLRQKYFKS